LLDSPDKTGTLLVTLRYLFPRSPVGPPERFWQTNLFWGFVSNFANVFVTGIAIGMSGETVASGWIFVGAGISGVMVSWCAASVFSQWIWRLLAFAVFILAVMLSLNAVDRWLESKNESGLMRDVMRSVHELPPPPSLPRQPTRVEPDIVAVVVNPATPWLVFWPVHATAKDVQANPLLWDVDREDKSLNSLRINQMKYDWIRQDQHAGPTSLLHADDINTVVKIGHRIFGYIQIGCPDCRTIKLYFVYFEYGKGGSYAEIPPGKVPDPRTISEKLIPAIRQDGPQKLFAIPGLSWVQIHERP